MKLGIFECGYMPKSLQEKFISYPQMLIHAFNNINCDQTFMTYDVTQNQFPKDMNECDAYITTGSSHSVNDDFSWIAQMETFIQQCSSHEKKLVGICFGHQLLAKALGGEVKKSEKGTGIGIIENQLLQHKAWIQPSQPKFNMIISHEDQVVVMPDNAVLLASNTHCRNFMMQIDDNFLGIQGHPEFNNEFSRRLMMIRTNHIPNNILEAAYDSLLMRPDNHLVMQWIIHFLGYQSKH